MERKKRNKAFGYGGIIALLAIAVLLVVLSLVLPKETLLDEYSYPVGVTLGEKAGFNVTLDSIELGTVVYASNAKKDVALRNTHDFPVIARMSVEGTIEPYLLFPDSVYLEPGEEHNITVSTIRFVNEPYGRYDGTFFIRFYRSRG